MFHWPASKSQSSMLMASKALAHLNNSFQSALFASTGFKLYQEQPVVLEQKYQCLEAESQDIYQTLYALRLR